LGAFALTVMAGLFAALPLELGTTALLFAPLVGAVYYLAAMRRYWRRRRVVRQPFPEAWRHRLESCVDFYGKLDAPEKGRFEQSVQIFLSEQRIYGVRGAEVPDEAKVLVAASAAMISHGLPEWEWPTIRDIVIYPSAFDEDYDAGRGKNIIGMVHAQGPILFSGPQLSHGFCVDRDGHNVGLHEMAHVLDMADGRADGIPAGVQWVSSAPWLSLVADRLRRVRRGQMRRILRGYAGKNEAEFFAVAVETFFEKPTQLADKDSELFEMLADYFNLDPRTAKLRRPLATARSDQ
jgi:Mlc titration factor MtfA (ptsG expression regulator)